MTFEPLSFFHQEPIKEALDRLSLPLSEYSFATLYLFRNEDQYFFFNHPEGRHWVRGVSRQKEVFLMPLFRPVNWQECVDFGKRWDAKYLFPIAEEWVDELSSFQIQFDDDEDDYCFDRVSIQEYSGRHFDGQRNWVRRLVNAHRMRVEPYKDDLFEAADSIINGWLLSRANGIADVLECREGIQFSNRLGLQGFIFFSDEKPVGFIFGEPFPKGVFLLHFAKAVRGYPGIYQYMYQEVARRLPDQYRWMNWEQDLGIENLRAAKRAYHPARFFKKAKLYLN